MNDINNPLEDIKVQAALQSEYMKLEYRKKNRPGQVNILDYTVISALEKQIPKKPIEIKERHNFRGDVILKDGYCRVCKNEISSTYFYCNKCGQAIDWGNEDE
jgi:hypothetical protein